MIAVILHIEETNPAIAAAIAWTPFPLSLVLPHDHPEREDIEGWAEEVALSLIVSPKGAPKTLPQSLSSRERVGLEGAKEQEIKAALNEAAGIAERHGAAWVEGSLNRQTLGLLASFVRENPEGFHFVAYEAVTKPPTTPQWRRRCKKSEEQSL